jgi:hypothetical protein
MEPISLQLMDPKYKPNHARAYTIPRSVEQQLQQSKEIVILVYIEIGVLEEDYFSEWASPKFAPPKKYGTIIVATDFRKNINHFIIETSNSPISYSKDWAR